MKIGLIGSKRLYKIEKPLKLIGLDVEYIKKISLDIFRFRGDVIIVDIAGLQIFIGWLIKKINRDCILIYRARGDYTEELHTIKKIIISFILKNFCDYILAVSNSLRKTLIRKNVINDNYILYVPIPKNIEKYSKKSMENKKLSYFILITITNFNYFKKIKPTLDRLEIINNWLEEINGYWWIIGSGKYLTKLIDYIRRKKLRRIKYLGYIEDITNYLQMADIMLHLSNLEGLPNSVLEGMLAKLPVVVNDYPPLKEIGPVIIVKDNRELELALTELYENIKLRKKIGYVSYKYATRNYNYKTVGLKFKQILEHITQQ